jgi:hypothetical protein
VGSLPRVQPEPGTFTLEYPAMIVSLLWLTLLAGADQDLLINGSLSDLASKTPCDPPSKPVNLRSGPANATLSWAPSSDPVAGCATPSASSAR